MYTYRKKEDVDHPLFLFETDNDLTFVVRMDNFPYNFADIEQIRSIVIYCDELVKPPYDCKVGPTVCAIIEHYLSENQAEVLFYVCDDLDKRGSIRQRKFDMWYCKHENGLYTTLLQRIISLDGSQIFTCLIFDPKNYNKNALSKLYIKELTVLEDNKD